MVTTLLGMAGRTGREEKRLQEEVIFERSLQVPSGNFGPKGVEVRTLQTQAVAGAARRQAAMKQRVALQLAGDTYRPVHRHIHVENVPLRCGL